MSFVRGLQCRERGPNYPKEPRHVCETCFGPLEIVYDYQQLNPTVTAEAASG
jgi:threonine synthase